MDLTALLGVLSDTQLLLVGRQEGKRAVQSLPLSTEGPDFPALVQQAVRAGLSRVWVLPGTRVSHELNSAFLEQVSRVWEVEVSASPLDPTHPVCASIYRKLPIGRQGPVLSLLFPEYERWGWQLPDALTLLATITYLEQVLDVGCLIGADIGDEARRRAVACDQLGVGQHFLGPREDVVGRDLDEQEAGHALDEDLEALILAAGGRTLALFTSWRAMEAAVAALRDRLPFPVLDQQSLPKPALVKAFTDDPSACLFATMGFWQGVDVPGPSLSLVAIDRIPFPRPDEPLVQARRDRAGPAAFRSIMRDARLREVIKIIETPKADDPVRHDRRMLRRLRAYARASASRPLAVRMT